MTAWLMNIYTVGSAYALNASDVDIRLVWSTIMTVMAIKNTCKQLWSNTQCTHHKRANGTTISSKIGDEYM